MKALDEDYLRDMNWLATGASQCVDIGVAWTWLALKKSLDQENLSEFERLLEKLPSVDFASQNGYTAIHLAVIKGRLDAIEILVKHNANIYACDEEGRTPPMRVQEGKAGDRIVEYCAQKTQTCCRSTILEKQHSAWQLWLGTCTGLNYCAAMEQLLPSTLGKHVS
jgi:ankyrin repeat protein